MHVNQGLTEGVVVLKEIQIAFGRTMCRPKSEPHYCKSVVNESTDAKISNLHMTVHRQQDVGWLDVPMHLHCCKIVAQLSR